MTGTLKKALLILTLAVYVLGCMGSGGSDRAGGGIEGSGVRDFELEGTVLDDQSRPLKDVTVSVENDISGEPVQTQTNAAGNFSLTASLAVDEQALIVFEGYNTRTQIELPAESNEVEHVRLKVKLKEDYEIEDVDVLPPSTVSPTAVPTVAAPSSQQPPQATSETASSVLPIASEPQSSSANQVESASSSSAQSNESQSSAGSNVSFFGSTSLNSSADIGPGFPD